LLVRVNIRPIHTYGIIQLPARLFQPADLGGEDVPVPNISGSAFYNTALTDVELSKAKVEQMSPNAYWHLRFEACRRPSKEYLFFCCRSEEEEEEVVYYRNLITVDLLGTIHNTVSFLPYEVGEMTWSKKSI